MDAEDRPDMAAYEEDGAHEDLDSATAELLRRVYARHVDIDTAARHLWMIDAAARVARQARRTTVAAAVRSQRVVAACLMSLMVLASSGVAVAASDQTLPGDSLYAVKLSTERMRLALAVRDDAAAQVQLAIARRRWEEAQRAAEDRPEVLAGLLKDTFDAIEAAERRGGAIGGQARALRLAVAEGSTKLALGEGTRGSADREPDGPRSESSSSAARTPPPASSEDGDAAEEETPPATADEEEAATAGSTPPPPPPPPSPEPSPPPEPATSTPPAATDTPATEESGDDEPSDPPHEAEEPGGDTPTASEPGTAEDGATEGDATEDEEAEAPRPAGVDQTRKPGPPEPSPSPSGG